MTDFTFMKEKPAKQHQCPDAYLFDGVYTCIAKDAGVMCLYMYDDTISCEVAP